MAILFPVNSLRNVAIMLVATPLVFPLDLDMLISRELSAIAADADRQDPDPKSDPDPGPNLVLTLPQTSILTLAWPWLYH